MLLFRDVIERYKKGYIRRELLLLFGDVIERNKVGCTVLGQSYCYGVCSIFLRADRSTNEIHTPRAFFFKEKYIIKSMYLCNTDIFKFTVKLANFFTNTYLKEFGLFKENLLSCSKGYYQPRNRNI